jgi:serine/threonine-protein kinase SRPK3
MPYIDDLAEERSSEMLGKPEVGYVQKRDGKCLEAGVPGYIVKPAIGWQLFGLFVGQPIFDTFLITPTILVGQMREMATNELPDRWQDKWDTMNTGDAMATESTGPNLQEWLEEVYFDGPLSPDLTREDIVRLGQIVGRLLHFKPSARASARQVLDDPWLNE